MVALPRRLLTAACIVTVATSAAFALGPIRKIPLRQGPASLDVSPKGPASGQEPDLAVPAQAGPAPGLARPAPAVPRPEPALAKPEPVLARPEPVIARPDPVIARPDPAPGAARAAGVAAAGEKGSLQVTVDRAKIIRLPDRTQTVVIGNPAIADLSIQKNGIVVVTGKSYGVTNVIALDAGGTVLAESVVSVSAPTDAIVTVQRGDQRQSYSCTPSCQPSVVLGDSTSYFSDNRSQAEQRNQFAVSR